MQNGITKRLKNAYRTIKRSLSNANASEWVSDNFYCIDRHYRALKRNRSALKQKRMLSLLYDCCEDLDFLVAPKDIISRLVSANKKFDLFELEAVQPLVCACAIIKIGEVLKYNKDAELIENAIKTLNRQDDPDYADIVKSVWAPERIIADFEPDFDRFTPETKSQYRKRVARAAIREGLDETDAALALVGRAKDNDCLIGHLLFEPDGKYKALWLAITASLILTLSVLSFFTVGWRTILLTLPFAVASSSVADYVLSHIAPPFSALRIELDSIPDDAKTLVTVASLITGKESDEHIYRSLLRFRYMNPDENIYFCLLADLPDADMPYMPDDNRIVENAIKRIEELNRLHGDRFCIFFRERVLNKSEDRYGGWERKRGAVCELVSHIVHGGKREYRGGDFIRDIKYMITLDADTNLSVGSVMELLSVALHPINRARVENGCVVSGFGIIQPMVRTELKSAYKTGFSRLISGSGGADAYSGASFVRSQALFGSGSFCGKGLIDVHLFDSLACNAFPEGVVLSHDVLEGSLLRTLAASDITLTDSTPANAVSFFRRHHRWMRGDFQNLYFLRSKRFGVLSKLRIIATAARHITPILSFAAVASLCFAKNTNGLWLLLLAYSELLLPLALTVASFFFNRSPFACVRFFSRACSILSQAALRVFFEICSGCRRAVLALDALTLALIRLCTRKKTLEWTTSAQTERLSSALGKYVLDGAASAIVGLLLLIFAHPPFIRLIGLLYFVYPLVSAVLARSIGGGDKTSPSFTRAQKEMLISHASDMFSFYYDNVNEKTLHLPPDNIQLSPISEVALRTSPTNIGFYFVSLLAARDLGLISTDELCTRLECSLDTVEGLKKYKGNLFNWYSLKDASVIGDNYVSAVDSGNFVVMLVALKEGLREYSSEDERITSVVGRVESLIASTDLTVFYDNRRALFCIGLRADGARDTSYYDMLMSEARMTAYYCVASALVPKKHWSALGRTLTHRSGYIGMMSWSGTAFEYFMPQLFLPLYRDSFMYESLAFALNVQRGENKIWGISESGFYSFDSEMRYQYKANGIQTLALRRISGDEKTVSPYSTYLALCICSGTAIKNLHELEKLGMYGKYGLYEAYDLNRSPNGLCVKSYMAHHVGMSIIAVLNAVKDNIFVRRFMSDIKMESASELLQEKIPTDAHIFEQGERYLPERSRVSPLRLSYSRTPDISDPNAVLLSRGDMNAIVTSNGHIALKLGDREITNTVFDKYSLRFTLGTVFTREGKSFGCAPLYGGDGYGFERMGDAVSFIASGKDFSGRVQYSLSKNSNCFIISTRAEALKRYDVTLAFEPVLETERNFQSHISFSRLFIESEYDPQRRILYFHRRSRLDGHHILTLAVAPRDKKDDFSFLTSRESLKPKYISSPLDYGDCEVDGSVGACIDPICVVRSRNAEGGKTCFLITCGQSVSECEQSIRIARADKSALAIVSQSETLEKMLLGILYRRGATAVESFNSCGINDLWARGISGDHPLAVVSASDVAKKRTESIINAFVTLARAMVRCELIFIVEDRDGYNRPVERSVRECCDRAGAMNYIGRNGGIFILRRDEISEALTSALITHADFYYDLSSGRPRNESSCPPKAESVVATQSAVRAEMPNRALPCGNGYFENESYTVDKAAMPLAPYSFVLTGKRFSTVVTQSSLGYTFYDNARERRLCSFYGDARSLDSGERLFLIRDGKKYDLCAISSRVVYEKGSASYFGSADGLEFTVTVTVDPRLPIKLMRVQYQKGISPETHFSVDPVMGDAVGKRSSIAITRFSSNGNAAMLFRNTFGMTFPEGVGFAGVCGGSANAEEKTLASDSNEAIFFLGACTTEAGAKRVISLVNKRLFVSSLQDAVAFAESMIPRIRISTRSEATDAMMNFFLPYQVAACRMYARGSFYQSGGAYGFRDQLQDCLSLIYSSPSLVRTHILRCCAHQYLEGDVMHWWHTRNIDRANNGIRSKCSDDLLYLPMVVADYIEKTGDSDLLDIGVRYVSSPPLGKHNERYEKPTRSDVCESVYHHCLRALSHADKRGRHGLILMGSCDWNDAFSLVGEKGIGESVFSTLLFVISAERFIPLCESRGDLETATHYKKAVAELRRAVEENAFFGDRYARAFCDDGRVLGIEGCKECEIDILSQAFAALAGLNRERTKKALSVAFSKLYDRRAKIFKLFSPPFENGKARVGYIRGYVAGIRENGGQYTHGALWGALGFLSVGMVEEALTVLECANPATRNVDRSLSSRYKVEPYVVSADVYSGEHAGRGGWSWYTGAASWFYRIMLEHILGLKFGAGRVLLSAMPVIAFNAEITLGNAKLQITATREVTEATVDGEKASFPLRFKDGEHLIRLPIK